MMRPEIFADRFLPRHREVAVEELIKKLGIGFARYIAKVEYRKLDSEKTKQDFYNKIKYLMDNLARDKSIQCRPFPGIEDCSMAMTTSQVYDSDRSGTGISRVYTTVGTDGVVIKVLGYDVLQKIKIFVRYPTGSTSYEDHDSSMSMTLIEKKRQPWQNLLMGKRAFERRQRISGYRGNLSHLRFTAMQS